LGAAFFAQFATSLAAGILSGSILTGGISEVLANVSGNATQIRATIVLQLLTSVAIIAMTSLLYLALRQRNRPIALLAFGWWLAEAAILTASTLGLSGLLPLSAEYVKAGAPASSEYQTLGTLFLGVYQHAGDIAMLFFCLGAFLWYCLLYQSRLVPRWMSVWGLLAVAPVLVGTLLLVWDRSLDPSFALYLPYVPFELVIGLWLLIRGARPESMSGGLD
jgi:hypothetical protein